MTYTVRYNLAGATGTYARGVNFYRAIVAVGELRQLYYDCADIWIIQQGEA